MLRTTLLTALAIVGLALPFAHAQTGPIAPSGAPTGVQSGAPSGAPTAPAAMTPAGGVMNDPALLEYLKKLDPNLRTSTSPNGHTTHTITLKHKDLTVPINVVDMKRAIWLEINLGPLGNTSSLPPSVIAEMLNVHIQIAPTALALKTVGNGQNVYLLHRVDRAITSERLQSALNEFLGDLETSQKLWQQLVQK